MSDPEPFDFSKPDELVRWFREMKSYLRTEDFLNQGTDREGRQFAWDGLFALETLLCTPLGLSSEIRGSQGGLSKEEFDCLGVDIDFIPFGNNPEDEVSGVAFTHEQLNKIKKALFGDGQ